MGVLIQAKNGEELFWNIEISMGRLSMHSKSLDCFSFKICVGRGRIFFHFSFVPFKFPMGSHRLPSGSLSSQCVPQYIPQIAHHIIPDALP